MCARVHANLALIVLLLRFDAISDVANLVQVLINPCLYYLSVRWPQLLPFGTISYHVIIISHIDIVDFDLIIDLTPPITHEQEWEYQSANIA